MKPPARVLDVKGSAGKHNKVHYESPDGRTLWCGQSRIFVVNEGERIRVWHRTKGDVTCRPCVKKLEKAVAATLGKLTADQLEGLAAHVESFSMKYPPDGMDVPEATAPGLD